jgi:hypothetical protein
MGNKKGDKETYYANKGIARNKRPLKNLRYLIEISQLRADTDKTGWEQYKFKDLGYLILNWGYENGMLFWHGPVTPAKVKELIGEKQWSKFCGEGKRDFIIQRRIDGKNIPLQKLERKDNKDLEVTK